MKKIITHSDKGEALASQLTENGLEADIIRSPKNYQQLLEENEALIFIGSLGICVREISPFIQSKTTDPAVINIDINGQYVQPVISGHLGGANKLSKEIAGLTGGLPVITTVSDTSDLWALDNLPAQFNWKIEPTGNLTQLTAAFVNMEKTALLLEVRDKGTLYMETSVPRHVDIFYSAKEISPENYKLIIAVTPYMYELGDSVIYYRPPSIHLGLGSQRGINNHKFIDDLREALKANKISPLSIASIATVEMKKDEEAFNVLSEEWDVPLYSYDNTALSNYKTSTPSQKVEEITGCGSVSEAAAMHSSENKLAFSKTKRKIDNKYYTVAGAIDPKMERKGFVEFVGAGPGDPELISVKGKKFLKTADLILYAGSLVPKELTSFAKKGCVVKSSANMDLQTQIDTMKSFYDRGLFIVRLHTGDPCVYGAIQEQMTELDKLNMNYHITPGISSFQAAASALKSQFTIPEEVQSIILTRGEGRTPVPEKEKLHKLAASQSTMCIFLSASLVEKVQSELEVHYPPETPVAICYKLTWKDEKIYRCTLATMTETIRKNHIKMTTLIAVGKAIDNRSGKSKLYDTNFSHAYRQQKQE